ncbi:MAG: helix-turn-helix domain-containing protein [Chitinophagaceae bacterium]|nr:helix-turn-helix domain-containing protein [Chitinophagaceae bacterium]
MDLKEQIIKEYLEQGCGYRKLQAKYGIGRTTICKWVQIYQGVHGLDRTTKQQIKRRCFRYPYQCCRR